MTTRVKTHRRGKEGFDVKAEDGARDSLTSHDPYPGQPPEPRPFSDAFGFFFHMFLHGNMGQGASIVAFVASNTPLFNPSFLHKRLIALGTHENPLHIVDLPLILHAFPPHKTADHASTFTALSLPQRIFPLQLLTTVKRATNERNAPLASRDHDFRPSPSNRGAESWENASYEHPSGAFALHAYKFAWS